jgi:hypothetical protein
MGTMKEIWMFFILGTIVDENLLVCEKNDTKGSHQP